LGHIPVFAGARKELKVRYAKVKAAKERARI
jgi:hypothetical protein